MLQLGTLLSAAAASSGNCDAGTPVAAGTSGDSDADLATEVRGADGSARARGRKRTRQSTSQPAATGSPAEGELVSARRGRRSAATSPTLPLPAEQLLALGADCPPSPRPGRFGGWRDATAMTEPAAEFGPLIAALPFALRARHPAPS